MNMNSLDYISTGTGSYLHLLDDSLLFKIHSLPLLPPVNVEHCCVEHVYQTECLLWIQAALEQGHGGWVLLQTPEHVRAHKNTYNRTGHEYDSNTMSHTQKPRCIC